jgi:hypothetical protein
MILKRISRKAKHLAYLRQTLRELRYDTINTVLVCSHLNNLDDATEHLLNNARLIRKYERRRKWLKL